MEEDLFDEKTLSDFKKPQLIKLIMELQKEKTDIKKQLADMKSMEDRMVTLERSHYLYLQYGRRESIEITGIPEQIQTKDLEKEVIKVYQEARVEIHGRQLDVSDISACHRVGKKGVTIVRFVNRKFAMQGLYKGKNLKGTKLYGNTPVYINNSFCKEFKFYGYIIRQLKNRSLIDSYKIRNGVYLIKTLGNLDFVEVSHITDFGKYNLDISSFLE